MNRNVYRSLKRLDEDVKVCTKCILSKSRTHAVPGEGSSTKKIMFIGEGPGADEDSQGRPFVGRSGKVLDTALEEAGISRNEVFITNVVKCRPPQNRKPKDDEMDACNGYLESQIELIDPIIICLLGATAIERLIGKRSVTGSHGTLIKKFKRSFFLTFHPAATLRNPTLRPLFFSDIKEMVRRINSREIYGRNPDDHTLV